MSSNADAVIEIKGVSKSYRSGEVNVQALDSVALEVRRGEFTAIAGPSGSGKSTLLNLMSGLDNPTQGTVLLAGTEIGALGDDGLSDFRRDHIGFVFQAYNLLPVLSVEENIEYIMVLQRMPKDERRARVREILAQVGLKGLERRRPDQLSGGQQQRVAIARAMVSRPDIILADEPTANLDSHTGSELLDLMQKLNETTGMTFVFSTHDSMIMERAKRLILLRDGRIASDERRIG